MIENIRMVCGVDGVELVQNSVGRWIHLGELAKDVDPDHDADPMPGNAYSLRHFGREHLRQAASDMIRHHGTIHPDSACEFSIRLRAALRS